MTTQSLSCTPFWAGEPPDLPGEEQILGRAARENFKVASKMLPGASRDHLMAFYGYARLVDQIGDEYGGDRMGALDWVDQAVRGALEAGSPVTDGTGAAHLISDAVGSVRRLDMDAGPLFDLIEANRRDQTVTDYLTFGDLMSYCRLSANPVGRLVLGAFGIQGESEVAWSDSICTGLQLAEHWQDVAEDAAAGRIYLPAEDRVRFGVHASDLQGGAAAPAGPPLRALLVFEVARARRYLDAGAPLIRSVRGTARWAIAGFWAGGQAALDAIAAQEYDVLGGAPQPRLGRVARHMVTALIGRAGGMAG